MKEKIKEFLKPVEGGPWDGIKFWPFMFALERLPLVLIIIAANILVVNFDETMTKPIAIGVTIALSLIATLVLYKSLQHWDDMKNHTSR